MNDKNKFVKNWLNRIDDYGHMTILNALWFNDDYQAYLLRRTEICQPKEKCTYTYFIHYYQGYIMRNEDSSMHLINKLWECTTWPAEFIKYGYIIDTMKKIEVE